MYCPKCSDVLEVGANGALSCKRGGMDLSKHLERQLRECYVERIRVPRDDPFAVEIGGQWFCPGCGVRAVETHPGDLRCPRCRYSLREFIRELIELHPHAAGAVGSGLP